MSLQTRITALAQAVGADVKSLVLQVTGHTGAIAGAHAATAVSNTPAGNISATTVQAAINEIDSKVGAKLSDAPSNGKTYGRKNAAWVEVAAGGSPGLVLLATVTPTAAASVDFLNVFSSAYDNYLILGSGICFSADEGLNLRLAASGSADGGSNYVQVANESINSSIASTSIQLPGAATIRSAGKGCNFEITIFNANDTGRFKGVKSRIVWNDVVPTSYIFTSKFSAYIGANPVTGFRLFSTFGASFAAMGAVRVYGYAKT